MSQKTVNETFYAIESKANRGNFLTVDINGTTVPDANDEEAVTASTADRLFYLMEEYSDRLDRFAEKFEVVKIKRSVTVKTYVYDTQAEENAWNEKRRGINERLTKAMTK